ncbi:hypothetical cytosolic protein [Syntrophus aciditrophicus SB]|uniref:Hypothetical cytosolic protein n=1 Tax=Syntrophus aciditrophicus (strain SB) TaxID=56780 RepID=Q2LV24_SYNAS|nr:hypothetical cytosolic protein [Syntrophus aciditrophicus SB]
MKSISKNHSTRFSEKFPDAPHISLFSVLTMGIGSVSQTFAIHQLGKSHDPELTETSEMLDAEIAVVFLQATF